MASGLRVIDSMQKIGEKYVHSQAPVLEAHNFERTEGCVRSGARESHELAVTNSG